MQSETATEAVISNEGYCYVTGCEYSYEDCVGGECKKSELPDVTFYTDNNMQTTSNYMNCAVGTDATNLGDIPDGCYGAHVGGDSISSVNVSKGVIVYDYQSQAYMDNDDGNIHFAGFFFVCVCFLCVFFLVWFLLCFF